MILFSTVNNVLFSILFLVLAYLIGAIPFGLIFGLVFKHQDIRKLGSGNIGSTNTIRNFGLKIGIPVFILEVLKGGIVLLLVKYVFDKRLFDNNVPIILYGFCAALGHLFPIYIGFKGGKIVAPSLGILLSLTPVSGLTCLIIFAFCVLIIGYVSIGSVSAAWWAILICWIQYIFGFTDKSLGLMYIWGKPELITCLMYTVLGFIITYRHKTNFVRIKNHTENKAKLYEKIHKKSQSN